MNDLTEARGVPAMTLLTGLALAMAGFLGPFLIAGAQDDATASLSPSEAADVSQTAADIIFQGDRLAPLAETLRTVRHARRLVLQNFGLALLYNLIAVPVAVAGYVTPLIAAVAMSASSVIVIANALRLNLNGPKPKGGPR